MSFYAFVVRHPVGVAMLTLLALVFGLVSYAQLPLNLMPDISYPTVTVRTEYPGAAPEEVETQVSRPIEEALSTVEGLVEVESRSRAGVSDVVLEFDWGTPMSAATQDVRERMQTTFLPEGTERPLILRYDPALDPILRVALAGAEDTSLLDLREYAETELKRRLETVDGVAAVVVRGGLERRVLVEPREDWLAARGVTLDQLAQTLGAENVNLAGGIVREGENEYLIRTLNELRSVEEIADMGVRRADGTVVRVGEVATVREGAADREVVARLDGRDAVELEVYKEADANIVTVARAVKAELEDVRLAEGMTTHTLDDQAAFVEAALVDLVTNAALGGLLAVLVTFVFLRDWTATLIISSAIPICLLVTFGVMYMGGTTLNLMSLGGLALGISMVIDSGTVVLENIQNHVDAGKSRLEAAVAGSGEVAGAVFASVLTGMAVFFPIVFVEGVAGQIFGDLALTVVFSLLTSLVVALVVIPMLGSIVIRLPAERPGVRTLPAWSPAGAFAELRQPRRWWAWPWALLRFVLTLGFTVAHFAGAVLTAMALKLGLGALLPLLRGTNRATLWLADRFLAVYARLEALFARGLAASLGRPGPVLLGAALSFVVGLVALDRVGSELIPEVRQGRFTAEVALPVGTPLSRTDAVLVQLEREIRALPDVRTVYAVVGTERRADARSDEGEHTARVLVELAPGGDFEAREDRLMGQIRGIVATWPRMELRFARPVLFSVRTPVELVLFGSDLPQLRAASERALSALARVPGLTDLQSSLTAGYPEVRVRYDRLRMDALGLGVGEVARAVRDKVQGTEATRVTQGDRRVDLLVRLDERDRASVDDLGALNVNPRLVPPIRLDTVARLEEAEGPSEVRRIDQRRAVVLSANVDGFDLAGAGERAMAAVRGAGLPEGVEVRLAGQNQEMERSLSSLLLALGLAVFLVYVIMASTFESVRDPFVILFSVPLALVGVAAGLWLTSTPISITVFIGLIVLAGVVVANAIVLVDAINRLRDEGRSLDDAIQGAAALRLRPILITALNSVLGLVPLAVGFGEGAEMQRPMAITIIFGLTSSTFLTLVVVPVVYRLVSGGRKAAAA